MYKELKQQIVDWLFEHENEWQRTNACVKTFREYIYNSEGDHLIGGEDVYNFIRSVEDLIYEKEI